MEKPADALQRRKPDLVSFSSDDPVSGRAQLMMTARRNEFQDFAYLRRKEEVQLWLEDVFQVDIDGEVTEALRDGTLLCELINKIVPGAVQKVHKAGAQEFFQRENVKFFVDACVDKLGMPRDQLFESADLCDLENPRRVIGALLQLEGVAARRGFAPCISRFREEEPGKDPVAAPEPVPTYEPVKGDDVDVAVGQLLADKEEVAKPRRRKVKRLSKGKYVIDGLRLNLKQANGKLMVRVGGGWMGFREFFEHHKLMDQYEALTSPGGALGPSSGPAAQRALAKVDLKAGPVIHVAVPEGFVAPAAPSGAKPKKKKKKKKEAAGPGAAAEGGVPVAAAAPKPKKKKAKPKPRAGDSPSSDASPKASVETKPKTKPKKSPRPAETAARPPASGEPAVKIVKKKKPKAANASADGLTAPPRKPANQPVSAVTKA